MTDSKETTPHAFIPTVFGSTDMVKALRKAVLEYSLKVNPQLTERARGVIQRELERLKR